MGNSTGSMFYMFIIVIGVYIIGMLAFLGFQQIKKWFNKRRDLKFQERRNHHEKQFGSHAASPRRPFDP